MTYQQVFLRLSVAVGIGALIGLDRELRHKPAGLRTMALVSLGSAVFVLTAIDSSDGVSHDATSRAIQGVVTGVGFLGAGAILRNDTEVSVRGMTTAASIWLAAAGGIACGLAEWALVGISSTLGLLVLVLAPVERIIHNRRRTDRPDGSSAPGGTAGAPAPGLPGSLTPGP
jgi:putative Mg2+ transporter-C (MgtC) family protein